MARNLVLYVFQLENSRVGFEKCFIPRNDVLSLYMIAAMTVTVTKAGVHFRVDETLHGVCRMLVRSIKIIVIPIKPITQIGLRLHSSHNPSEFSSSECT